MIMGSQRTKLNSWLTFRYFEDEELLSRVKTVFLLNGGMYAAVALAGSCLMQIHPKTAENAETASDETSPGIF